MIPALRISVGLVVNPAILGSRADSSIDGNDAPSAKILIRSREGMLDMHFPWEKVPKSGK